MQLQQEKQTAKFNLLLKCGLLALNLANIFEKLLDQKLCLPAARFILMFNAQIFVPEAEFPAGQRVPVLHPILPLAEYPQRYT